MGSFIAGLTAWALVLALAGSAGAGNLLLGSTPGDDGGNFREDAAQGFVVDAEPWEASHSEAADSPHPAGISVLPADSADGAVTPLGILVFGDAASVTGPKVTGESRIIDAPEDVPVDLPGPSISGPVQLPLAADLPSLAATELPPSPDPSLSFEGLGHTGVIPPDTQGAVGPDHLMVVTNGAVRVMDRTGGVLSTMSDKEFWSFASTDVFDPRVLYDAAAGRWIVTEAADRRSPQSSVFLAVSASSDPTGAWFRWIIDADTADLLWADQPKVGFSGRWLVVTAPMFPNVAGAAARPLVMAFDKADVYAGSSASFVWWPGLDPTTWGFLLVPAETLDASTSDLYLLTSWSPNFGGLGFLQLAKVTGSVGDAMLSVVGFVASPEPWALKPPTNPPNFAPQLGTAEMIHPGDDRVQNLVFRNGSLWAAHTIYLPAGSPNRASVQWWNIETDGSVIQRGRVDDPSATYMYAYPSIGVNSAADVLVGFTRFSASEHPSAGMAFRFGTDPLNLMRDETIYKDGQATYVVTDTGGLNRWGDYSATVVDPLNDVDLWTIQEVSSATPDEWSTWWARVEVSALDREPPTWPQGASLSASDVGVDRLTVSWPAASDNVEVTGYRIFMNNTLIDELPPSTQTRVFTDLTQETTYTFVVQARDAIGHLSSALLGSFATATDAGVTVTPTSVNVTERGATGSYTVVLDSQPTGDVTVTRSVVGSDVTVSPSSRTFTTANWDTPQSFTVTAVDDFLVEGLHTDTVTHAAASGDANYSGVGIASVTANVTDDDAAGVWIIETGGSTTVTEGGSGDTYTVVLTAEPVANVTVIAAITGTQATVSPSSRTFTPGNWNVAQTFTVTAVDDPVAETSPHGDTISHSVATADPDFSGVVISDVHVSIFDDDTAGVTVTPTTVGVTEGAAGSTFTVVLNTQPSAPVTLNSTVVVGQATVTPLSRMFTTTNWNVPQSFTVVAVDDAVVEGPHSDTITLVSSSTDTDYQAVGVPSVTVDITDNDTLAVPLPGPSATVTGPSVGAPGIAATFSVTINSSAGSASVAWEARTAGIVAATGKAQDFTFTPTVAGSYLVSVKVSDNYGTSPAVAVLFTVLSDVAGSVFVNDIVWMANQGITRGCNPPVNDRFCPDDVVTRAQMAAFLVRALGLTARGTVDFVDDNGSIFEADIEKLAAAGITRGCNPPVNDRFCPDSKVTRGAMAAFLVRALGYFDDGGGDLFIDDDGSIFESDIDKLGTAGVTKGCNPPTNDRFCPDSAVTRGQMAAFLRRALG